MALTALVVWLSWLFSCFIAIGAGLVVLRLVHRDRRYVGPVILRVALWSGLSLITLIVLLWNLFLPFADAGALVLGAGLLGVAAVGWIAMFPNLRIPSPPPWGVITLLIGLCSGSFALAVLSLGIPINYDSGLYHLGAISYARDFGTIPGLANLHDRFGFNSSVFPLAAFLDAGMWQGEGFRLVVGVFMLAMAIDLSLRLLEKGKKTTAANMTLVISLTALWIYVLLAPGSLIASPTGDTIVVALVAISVVYLLDALARSEPWGFAAGVAIVTAALAGTMRPINWLFWLAVFVIALILARRRRALRSLVTAGILSGILVATMLVRDAILSGWLLFPFDRLPIPVDWRYPTPELTSMAITAWGRAPHKPYEFALTGYDWLIPWIRSLSRDWFILCLLVLVIMCAVLLIMRRPPKSILFVAMIPPLMVMPAWLVLAPDPRFAWGQILLLGTVPVAILLQETPISQVTFPLAGTVLVVGIVAAFLRGGFAIVAKDVRPQLTTLGLVQVTLLLAPPLSEEVTRTPLSDGTLTIEPSGDQCWTQFPLCRPSGSSPDIELRGEGIVSGFRPNIGKPRSSPA